MTATTEELQALYVALDKVNLKPGDIIPQIRLQGRKISHLGQLSSFEVKKLIKDCEKHETNSRGR